MFSFLCVSVSDSGSSQGLSQPSTQTTQYLRADTPNNAASVTSKVFLLHLHCVCVCIRRSHHYPPH